MLLVWLAWQALICVQEEQVMKLLTEWFTHVLTSKTFVTSRTSDQWDAMIGVRCSKSFSQYTFFSILPVIGHIEYISFKQDQLTGEATYILF